MLLPICVRYHIRPILRLGQTRRRNQRSEKGGNVWDGFPTVEEQNAAQDNHVGEHRYHGHGYGVRAFEAGELGLMHEVHAEYGLE